jgi:hypothetical protein
MFQPNPRHLAVDTNRHVSLDLDDAYYPELPVEEWNDYDYECEYIHS